METKKIIVATLLGTSAMTLFSYIVSRSRKKNFIEPELINEIAVENLPEVSENIIHPAAWTAHYSVGLAFTGVYSQLWEHTSIKPSLLSGAALGALSGLAGILGWSQGFKLDHHNSAPYRKQYYAQLMAAHIVFGMGAAAGYRLMGKNKEKTLPFTSLKLSL